MLIANERALALNLHAFYWSMFNQAIKCLHCRKGVLWMANNREAAAQTHLINMCAGKASKKSIEIVLS